MSPFLRPRRPGAVIIGAPGMVLLVAGLGAFGFGLGSLGVAFGLPVPGFSEMRAQSATPAQSALIVSDGALQAPTGEDATQENESVADDQGPGDWPAIFGTPRAAIAPPPDPVIQPPVAQQEAAPRAEPLDLDFTLKGMIVADGIGWALIEDDGSEAIYRVGDLLRDGIVISDLRADGVMLDTSEGPYLVQFDSYDELPSASPVRQSTPRVRPPRLDQAPDEYDDYDDMDDEDWEDDEAWDEELDEDSDDDGSDIFDAR